jgi:phosphoglycerol transferase MdoB-like AlkP superfamily enzyme
MTKNKLFYVSIIFYILFALVYWKTRKMIKSNHELNNIIFIVLLVALSYIYWNAYYRAF